MREKALLEVSIGIKRLEESLQALKTTLVPNLSNTALKELLESADANALYVRGCIENARRLMNK